MQCLWIRRTYSLIPGIQWLVTTLRSWCLVIDKIPDSPMFTVISIDVQRTGSVSWRMAGSDIVT